MFKNHPVLSVLLILMLLIVLAFIITGAAIMRAASGDTGEFDYLLVLGTVVEGDDPSPMLADRIRGACDCLTANPDVICIVSGGKGDHANLSEAQCMFNELTEMGIDPERIWMEDQATSTLENFEFSLALIEEQTGRRPERIGVLSSEFHLLRSRKFAEEQGLSPIMIPAKTTDPAMFAGYFLREIVVLWYYTLFA